MVTLIGDGSPWHAGEIAIQKRVGVADRMADIGKRVIRDFMPDQHREFYSQLPFLVVGTVDSAGAPWATIVGNKPGFVQSPDKQTLTIAADALDNDPAAEGYAEGKGIGFLGIELHTRRRNRMNGTITASGDAQFTVGVEHSYGNCPQYIQLRDYELINPDPNGETVENDGLSNKDKAFIRTADTFFVASYNDEKDGHRQVDVSHRGGKAGFVRVGKDGELTIPDFAGNLFFNTLGNIHQNGQAGLLFPDFLTGDVLQMTGHAEIDFDSEEIAAFQGAERIWRFFPTKVIRRKLAMPVRLKMQAMPWSPNSLLTGDWDEAAERLKARKLSEQWRPFKVKHVKNESTTIRSFVLEPTDQNGIIPHKAGQHLPIRLSIPSEDKPVFRTYTLSTAPSDKQYRISVKRDGLASQFLHDQIKIGDTIEARAPAGSFTLDTRAERSAVLLAAGVGITPILAMLRDLVFEGIRTRYIRPTTVYYAARTIEERAFDRELEELVRLSNGTIRLIRLLSQPEDGELPGETYDVPGRINMELLRKTLLFDDYDFYICGPGGFMQAVYDGLRDLNVSDKRIHAEAFGPSGLTRSPDEGAAAGPINTPSEEPIAVAFTESSKEARWTPESGTLLELAEARGLTPAYSCRSGSCGSCKVKIAKGAVSYKTPPSAEVGEDEALLCCSVPAVEGGGQLILEA